MNNLEQEDYQFYNSPQLYSDDEGGVENQVKTGLYDGINKDNVDSNLADLLGFPVDEDGQEDRERTTDKKIMANNAVLAKNVVGEVKNMKKNFREDEKEDEGNTNENLTSKKSSPSTKKGPDVTKVKPKSRQNKASPYKRSFKESQDGPDGNQNQDQRDTQQNSGFLPPLKGPSEHESQPMAEYVNTQNRATIDNQGGNSRQRMSLEPGVSHSSSANHQKNRFSVNQKDSTQIVQESKSQYNPIDQIEKQIRTRPNNSLHIKVGSQDQLPESQQNVKDQSMSFNKPEDGKNNDVSAIDSTFQEQLMEHEEKGKQLSYFIIRVLGTLIFTLSLATDFTYLFYARFVELSLRDIYVLMLCIRPVLLAMLLVYFIALTIQRAMCNRNSSKILSIDVQSPSFDGTTGNQIQEQDNGENIERKHKGDGTVLFTVCLLVGFPFFCFSGYIRLLGQKRYEIPFLAYLVIEFIGQTFPLFLMQLYNNNQTSWGTFEYISLVFSVLSMIDVLVECYYQTHMVRGKETQFLALCTDKAPSKFSEIIAIFIICILCSIICIFGFKNGFGEKQCSGENIYLDELDGQCKSCLDSFQSSCISCLSPENCTSCDLGFYLLEDQSACQDCTSSLGSDCTSCLDASTCTSCLGTKTLVNGVCQDCDFFDHCLQCGNGACTVCEENYVVTNDGTCETCQSTCASCVDGVCEECFPGFFLESDNTCSSCSQTLENCGQCSDANTCTLCADPSLTIESGQCICDLGSNSFIDDVGKCRCENGYYEVDGQCCKDDTFYIGGTCKSCGSVISSCVNCESSFTGTIQHGTDGRFVVCNDCGSNSKYFETSNSQCRACSTKFDACEECDFEGTNCNSCQYGYLEQTLSTGMLRCTSCGYLMDRCVTCVSEFHCALCEEGYKADGDRCKRDRFGLL